MEATLPKLVTGQALANERFAARVTQLALAREMEINRSTLSLIENGWKSFPQNFVSEYRAALTRLKERAA